MIVFIAGMPRSGSTFTYAVTRDALLKAGGTEETRLFDTPEEAISATESDHLLLKAHTASRFLTRLIKLGGCKSICTIRRLEDAAASWITTFGLDLEKTVTDMKEWVRMFLEIRRHSLVIPYSMIDTQPQAATRAVLRHLGLDEDWADELSARYSKEKVKQTYDELDRNSDDVLDFGFTHYHKDTLFHRRHVTDTVSVPAEERLSRDQLSFIRRSLQDEIAIVKEAL